MRIGELARRGECEVETVRFYEREGLLERPDREPNGYRRYADRHLVQLAFIRHCRSLGMSLLDVRALRDFQAHPDQDCEGIDHLIDGHIQKLHAQIESLRQLEHQLRHLREACRSRHTTRDCGILRNLERAAEGEACTCHTSVESGEGARGAAGRR